MNNAIAPLDWAGSRGDTWSANLTAVEAMLAPVNPPLLAALDVANAARVVDIGCGGGGATMFIAAHARRATFVGLDISPKLIADAAAAAEAQSAQVTFAVADATTYRSSQRFDRMVSRFGVMFFADPAAAFANLAGLLAPGGRFVFAVWAAPAANPWMTLSREVVAELVELPAQDPLGPGPFRYADVEAFRSLLSSTGFANVDVNAWRGMLALGGGLAVNQAAEFTLRAFSNLGEAVDAAGPATRTLALERLAQAYTPHLSSGVVALPAQVHIVTGSVAA